jgi:hypothetical protein
MVGIVWSDDLTKVQVISTKSQVLRDKCQGLGSGV